MMYDSWGMKHVDKICHFEPFFCPFTALIAQKIKIKKKKKKQPAGIILHVSIKKYDQIFLRYGVWWTDRQKDRKIDIQR